MKKSIIAAGAASVALAAMPIVGAFAQSTATVIDSITATVQNGCNITSGSGTRSVSKDLAAGTSVVVDGTAFTLVCNDSSWTVSAKGTGTGSATELYKAGATTQFVAGDGTATSTGLDGASNWGYKVTATGGTAPSNAYAAITEVDVPVVNGTENTGTITPSYKIYAAPSQEAGAYSGQVTYTVAIDDPQNP